MQQQVPILKQITNVHTVITSVVKRYLKTYLNTDTVIGNKIV